MEAGYQHVDSTWAQSRGDAGGLQAKRYTIIDKYRDGADRCIDNVGRYVFNCPIAFASRQ
ncbi:hypothetical protein WJ07_00845 [Burkholderia vietnamiensis]|nr:hypothetical protein WJ07_00845 [Burkholderia vietnamiensis]